MSDEEDEITTRTSKFIINLNLLMKHITIESNISEVLDSYLAYLRNSQIYLSNGIFKTNFAEGALVLQTSAKIYSKKIDLLWDCVIEYHERITSYEEKTDNNAVELQKIEERKTRFKRKKKVPEVQQGEGQGGQAEGGQAEVGQGGRGEDQVEVLVVEEVGTMQSLIDDYAGTELEGGEDDESYEFYQTLAETEDGQFEGDKLDSSYYDRWTRYIAKDRDKKTDVIPPILYESITEEITPAPHKINVEIPEILLKTSVYGPGLLDECETICEYTMTSITNIIDFESKCLDYQCNTLNIPVEKIRSVIPSEYIYSLFQNVPITDVKEVDNLFNEKYMSYMKSIYQLSPSLQFLNRKLCPQSLTVSLEVLPEEVLNKHLAKENFHKETGNPLRKTIDSHSDVDSGFFDHGDFDNHQDDTLNAATLTIIVEEDENTDLQNDDGDVDSGVEATIIEDQNKVKQKRKRRRWEVFDDITPRKRKPRQKLLPTITVKLRIFEKFFYENYQTEIGEGELIEPICESEPENDDCQAESDSPNSESISHEENNEERTNVVETTTTETNSGNESVPEKNTATITETNSGNESVPEKNTAETSVVESAGEVAEEKARRYNEWKDFIYKTIKQDMQVDYNIHEEGTKILNSIPESGVLKYSNYSMGKTSGENCRSFIAMLQLANTNNIEFQNTNPGKLANDTLELKLLSMERPHEKLLEYNAPSEVGLAEKMERVVRADKHCLPSTSGIVKRFKLG